MQTKKIYYLSQRVSIEKIEKLMIHCSYYKLYNIVPSMISQEVEVLKIKPTELQNSMVCKEKDP